MGSCLLKHVTFSLERTQCYTVHSYCERRHVEDLLVIESFPHQKYLWPSIIYELVNRYISFELKQMLDNYGRVYLGTKKDSSESRDPQQNNKNKNKNEAIILTTILPQF